ncbi:facilitated trehalose transporter Tret1-like isoform X3 [Rhodnius prolixus]
MTFGFPAIAIPQLEDVSSTLTINKVEASWIASLSAVTTPIGCILSGYLMDAIGRKKILIMTQLPTLAGWLLIASANNVGMLYAGRLLVGLGSGMVAAPARVYTAEATQPHLRGMLAAVASVGVSFGVLAEYFLGALFTWPVVALLSSLVPALALLGACLIPESPSWLMSAGREEDSLKSLKKLRGRNCDIQGEVDKLADFAKTHNVQKPSTVKDTIRALTRPSAIKPFFIIVLYFLIYQFSGVNPITFYAVQVFQESGATMDKYLATVIMGVVRLVFTVVACILMRRCGRRPLTFVSSVGCGISMVVLGTYMFFRLAWIEEGEVPKVTWLPVASMMVFTAASVIGYLVVPWVMIGEVYPTQVRGIIGGMTTCSAHFFIFLVVKTFPILQDVLSAHGTFWLYGGISLAGTLFFFYFLPETKGRTLQEIEDYFCGTTKTLSKPKQAVMVNVPTVLEVQKGNALP